MGEILNRHHQHPPATPAMPIRVGRLPSDQDSRAAPRATTCSSATRATTTRKGGSRSWLTASKRTLPRSQSVNWFHFSTGAKSVAGRTGGQRIFQGLREGLHSKCDLIASACHPPSCSLASMLAGESSYSCMVRRRENGPDQSDRPCCGKLSVFDSRSDPWRCYVRTH